eukprot:SAG22_NODE_1401_length_4497_cov_101.460891_3_plen_103_part_00
MPLLTLGWEFPPEDGNAADVDSSDEGGPEEEWAATDGEDEAPDGGERALVIVNLQRTPLDKMCTHRFFAKCDEVMRRLMAELEIPIPTYTPQPLPAVLGYRG